MWNSLHTGSLEDADLGYYETDLYAALTAGMFKAVYTAYTYPNIDDSAVHIEAARRFGMTAILVTGDTAALRKELIGLGLPLEQK